MNEHPILTPSDFEVRHRQKNALVRQLVVEGRYPPPPRASRPARDDNGQTGNCAARNLPTQVYPLFFCDARWPMVSASMGIRSSVSNDELRVRQPCVASKGGELTSMTQPIVATTVGSHSCNFTFLVTETAVRRVCVACVGGARPAKRRV